MIEELLDDLFADTRRARLASWAMAAVAAVGAGAAYLAGHGRAAVALGVVALLLALLPLLSYIWPPRPRPP